MLEVTRCVPLAGYSFAEYSELIGRGATRLMIQQFDLDFTEDKGISKLTSEM